MIVKISGFDVHIDQKNEAILSQYGWYVVKERSNYYVSANKKVGDRRIKIKLHREIMKLDYKVGVVDHINGNGLDNREENLRLSDYQKNSWNRKISTNKSSQFKGVFWSKSIKRWVSAIKKDGKQIHLGSFKDEILAGKAYDDACKILFGEYGRGNGICLVSD